MLATALVMPLFDYCCCVWSNCNVQNTNCLQVLMNRLGRILLSVDIKTSVDFILSTLGWKRLNVSWNEKLIIMTFKCLKGCAPPYLSSTFIFNTILPILKAHAAKLIMTLLFLRGIFVRAKEHLYIVHPKAGMNFQII